MDEISKKLSEMMPIQYITWRIGSQQKNTTKEPWAKILCYIDARAVMDRLDEVVGTANWSDTYLQGPSGGNICRLALKLDNEWVWKEDVADNTDVEGIKGGISDAFKRAAVKWGIGRYLYGTGETYAVVSREKNAACSHYQKFGDGKYFWGPPREAYVALGYSGEEINTLPYFSTKKHGSGASGKSNAVPPPQAKPSQAPGHANVTHDDVQRVLDGGHAVDVEMTQEALLAKVAECGNVKHLGNIFKKYKLTADNLGILQDFIEACGARKAELLGDPPLQEEVA